MNTTWNLIKLIYIISKHASVFEPLFGTNANVTNRIFYKVTKILFYPTNLFKKKHTSLPEALKEMGPIYIKLGQTLSTRPDILGQKACNSLRSLQDKLDPFSFETLEQIFSQETGKKLENVFDKFDKIPTAAASIAQVHLAYLYSGEKVAVKVLRPFIKAKCLNDLKVLKFLASAISFFYPKVKNFKPIEVLQIFEESMKIELNLRLEAAHASELKNNLKDHSNVYIPCIYWNLTTEQLLVSQWIDGISIYDTQKLKDFSLDTIKLSQEIATLFFEQTYKHGFFHADLHPGNIFVTITGQIAFVDFGIMGRLSKKDRMSVAQILQGFLRKDYIKVARIHLEAGYIPKDTNLDIFALHCRSICEPIAGLALKDVAISKILSQLFQVIQEFGLSIQPQLILLQKSMILIEGVGKILNPEINMWKVAYPWMEKWTIQNLGAETKIINFFSTLKKSIEKKIFEDFDV